MRHLFLTLAFNLFPNIVSSEVSWNNDFEIYNNEKSINIAQEITSLRSNAMRGNAISQKFAENDTVERDQYESIMINKPLYTSNNRRDLYSYSWSW